MGWIEKMPEDKRREVYALERERMELYIENYLRADSIPSGEARQRIEKIKARLYSIWLYYGGGQKKRRIIKRARLLRR